MATEDLKELGVFVLAVSLGSVGGLATSVLLGRWVGSAVASNAALAVATTCTGAAHSHFVHKQPWRRLLPKIGLGAPLAYGVMRAVHAVLGSEMGAMSIIIEYPLIAVIPAMAFGGWFGLTHRPFV